MLIRQIAVCGLSIGIWAVVLQAQDSPPAGKAAPATPPAKSPDAPPKPKTREAYISELLNSNDVDSQDLAVAEMRESLADRSHQTLNVNDRWIKRLAALQRFDEADEIAVLGIINARTDLVRISALQRARVLAFLDAGDAESALAAAKAHYNLCGMGETRGAIEVVSRALAKARPDDPGIAQRFKAEQLARAALAQPAAAPTTAPSEATESILKSIKVDASPFEEAAERLQPRTFGNALAKGNLLLLCDRAAEARVCFETARNTAKAEKQLADAIEGVARSIRAETHSVGAANAFVLDQQQGE